jgi:hypothetical protein
MIYETDTNRVLVWDNAAWVMIADADTPPGLDLVKTQTVGSGVLTVAVTNAFSANHDNYRIVLTGIDQSNQSSFTMSLNNSTGSTYQQAGTYQTFGSSTLNVYGPSTFTQWTDILPGDTTLNDGFIDIYQPFTTTPTIAFSSGVSIGAAVGYYKFWNIDTNTASHTGFTIGHIDPSTTMTGGTIRVYGYRNTI